MISTTQRKVIFIIHISVQFTHALRWKVWEHFVMFWTKEYVTVVNM